jgi:hypothetical protein
MANTIAAAIAQRRKSRVLQSAIDEKMRVHIGDRRGEVGYAAVGDTALA